MSSVAVLFKVYPKENMLDQAVKDIKEKLHPTGMQVEDLAFGIKVIKVMFKFDNEQTTSSKFEEELKNLDSVGEIEVEEEGLL